MQNGLHGWLKAKSDSIKAKSNSIFSATRAVKKPPINIDPRYVPQLSIQHNEEIMLGYTQLQRIQRNKGKVEYKFDASAVAEIRLLYGKESLTIGDDSLFGRMQGAKKKCYFRCNVCVLYPSHMITVGRSRSTPAIASFAGKKYDLVKMIDHYLALSHESAIDQYRAEMLKRFLKQNPSENVADFTTNVLLQDRRGDETFQIRLKQISMVYNDLKSLTISARTFPSRDLLQGYVAHCLSLKDKPWTDYVPTQAACRYNNPTAHQRYRRLFSEDIRQTYVNPMFGSKLLACCVGYDGWRAFADSTLVHVFVALIKPESGGAAGCVESFKKAYRGRFKTEKEFKEFLLKVVAQVSDKASTMAGNKTGANKQIREDVIGNALLPEMICTGHCGHNSCKDTFTAFGCVDRCVTDHNSLVAFSHRGEIWSDFKKYCVESIFVDVPKEDHVVPARFTSAGTTRMESHLHRSIEGSDGVRDLWMLSIEDRMCNHRDSHTRVCVPFCSRIYFSLSLSLCSNISQRGTSGASW